MSDYQADGWVVMLNVHICRLNYNIDAEWTHETTFSVDSWGGGGVVRHSYIKRYR